MRGAPDASSKAPGVDEGEEREQRRPDFLWGQEGRGRTSSPGPSPASQRAIMVRAILAGAWARVASP